jgi:hypothetical protein
MKATHGVWSVMALAWLLAACDRQQPPAVSDAVAAASAAEVGLNELGPTGAGAMPEPVVVVSPEQQQAYEQEEQRYATDPSAQWAVSGQASSSAGESAASKPQTMSEALAWRATGAVDGRTWSNGAEQRKGRGVDWLEVGFDHAVQTSEVRAVLVGAASVRSIVRVDVIEEGGIYHTVWEGSSDVLPDVRGPRTWFVRQFEKTPYKVQGVKLLFLNEANSEPKEVDAVQLVGR